MPRYSVVVPAHNEEELIARCLDSIDDAALVAQGDVEVVVVANRCTDATEEIADARGARVVVDFSRTIGAVRNAGAEVATGDIVVTLDADSRMSPCAFVEVERKLATGRIVGGGAKFVPERTSPGIATTMAAVKLCMLVTGLGGAMFWCARRDFEAVGGFDPSLQMAEDLDFARRLRAHGRLTGRRFTNLHLAPVLISTRKFDRFGDWHMLGLVREASAVRASMRGDDRVFVDRYFYDFNG
jgi:glycosyltransferase involved in cell wall biosynthesis